MFDRFTDRARKTMGFSRQEAQRFNHDYIGTEHILLGLIEVGTGVATDVLKNLDVDPRRVRQEVEKLLSLGATMITMGQIPFTPAAKKVLELALEEANNLGLKYVGTEHLLLGLIREGRGVAARVFERLAVRLSDVREEVLELLGGEPANEPKPTRLGPVAPFFIVKDVPRAVAFYREKLAFRVSHSEPKDDTPFFAIVRRGDAQLILKAITDDVGPQPNHTRHEWARWDAFVCADDPDSLAEEFAGRGVTFHEELRDWDDGLRGFAVRDADGYVLFFGRPT